MSRSTRQTQTRSHPDLPHARTFSTMTSEEQKGIIERRFADIDPAELVTIVKAIYGHPHDKGRPRRTRDQTRRTQNPAI